MDTIAAATSAAPAVAGVVDFSLAERWTSYIDAAPKTVETYTKGVRLFLRWLAERGVKSPAREDVLAYRAEMAAAHKPTTASNYLAAVKLFFKWTASEGLFPNVADRVKGVKLDREHKKDYLLEAQVRKVLGTIDRSSLAGLRDYAIVALMVTTGLRAVSVVRADIGDIRPAGASMVLYYQGKGHAEKAKYVKLAPEVDDAIREYLAARGEKSEGAPLFASVSNRNGGGRLTTRSLSRLLKNGLVEAGITSSRVSGHSLRHSCATLNLLHGGTLEETQQLLDHANITTTLIYSHALERAKNESENRIARAIFG